MNQNLETEVNRSLPVRVDQINVNDPLVSIVGERWALALACPWDLIAPGVEFDWQIDSIEDALQGLVGAQLQAVTGGEDLLNDPTFHFDRGISIGIRADTDLDPWVLHFPGLVLVGRMTSPETGG